MEEQNILEMTGNPELGKVEIAPEVIEVIAGIAASEVDGIGQMRGGFATGVVERLGKRNHGKGVKVELTEEGIIIDIFCTVRFGVSIPEVAQKVQDNVHQTLLNMTALETTEVNVHVVAIQFESERQEADEQDK